MDKISFSRDISLFEDVFGPEKDLNVEKSHILGQLRISYCTVSCLQLRIAIIRRSLSQRLLRESKQFCVIAFLLSSISTKTNLKILDEFLCFFSVYVASSSDCVWNCAGFLES